MGRNETSPHQPQEISPVDHAAFHLLKDQARLTSRKSIERSRGTQKDNTVLRYELTAAHARIDEIFDRLQEALTENAAETIMIGLDFAQDVPDSADTKLPGDVISELAAVGFDGGVEAAILALEGPYDEFDDGNNRGKVISVDNEALEETITIKSKLPRVRIQRAFSLENDRLPKERRLLVDLASVRE